MQKVKKICLFVSFWSEFSSDDYVAVGQEKSLLFFVNSSYLLWSYAKKYIIS